MLHDARYLMLDTGCWIDKRAFLALSRIQKPESSIYPYFAPECFAKT
jgi:hypothetical protein